MSLQSRLEHLMRIQDRQLHIVGGSCLVGLSPELEDLKRAAMGLVDSHKIIDHPARRAVILLERVPRKVLPYIEFPYDEWGQERRSEHGSPFSDSHPRATARLDRECLSRPVRPRGRTLLEPADPRMRGWRMFAPERAVREDAYTDIHHPSFRDLVLWSGSGDDDISIDEQIRIHHLHEDRERRYLWENPESGEVRECTAKGLPDWTPPWRDADELLRVEIESRTPDIPGELLTKLLDAGFLFDRDQYPGWHYSDEFWTQHMSAASPVFDESSYQSPVEADGRRGDLTFHTGRKVRLIKSSLNLREACVGDLSFGGSTASSEIERSVRRVLEDSGMTLLPPSVISWGRPDSGGVWRATPDIIVVPPRGRRLTVVEVDPYYTHSGYTSRGESRVDLDKWRNRMHARAGHRVVCVRIGGCRKITPNDVVIDRFDVHRHADSIVNAVRSAHYVRAWRMR